jgi:hypothetical protein
MTPLDFADEYYNVCVQYQEPQSQIPVMHFVRVEKYRINREQSSHYSDVAEKDRLVGRVRRAMREANRAGTNGPQRSDITSIARSFFAKGSPADYETTLRCALRYGGTQADQLQQYADRRLGLDCSGFVNQYWIAIGVLNGYGNSKTIRQYGQANRRRSAITPEAGNPQDPRAIKPLDMLLWTDFGHIAIIDHIITTSAGTQAIVVESTANNVIGPGLVHSTYRINSVNERNKKFNVRRGNSNTNVYIASFDPISR